MPRGICFEIKNKSKQIMWGAFLAEFDVAAFEVFLGAGHGGGPLWGWDRKIE